MQHSNRIHLKIQFLRINSEGYDIRVAFGGKIIVLGGDFRQVLPVVPHGLRASTIQNSIRLSPLWSIFKALKLTTNMCVNSGEKEFAKILLEIGNGVYPCCESDKDEETIYNCLRL